MTAVAAIVNGDSFTANPKCYRAGLDALPFIHTFVAANLDTIGDKVNLISIPAGKKPVLMYYTCGDLDAHATPTLDMDLVVSQNGLPGVAGTETIIDNTGTLFQGANTGRWVIFPLNVDDPSAELADNVDGNAVLRTKVNAVSATFQAGTIRGILFVR